MEPSGDFDETSDINKAASVDAVSLDDAKYRCKICCDVFKDPRVLSCLHVFCKSCIENKLIDVSGHAEDIIVCSECQQETKVGSDGVAALLRDYVLIKLINSSGIEASAQLCTSCDSRNRAVSVCRDCTLYLCTYCHCAHQTIRCLKDHNVVQFVGTVPNSSKIKGPVENIIFCETHPTMKLRVFCTLCEVVACSICICSDHMGHHGECKGLKEALAEQTKHLETLMIETKAKIAAYTNAASSGDLNGLVAQRDNIRQVLLEKYNMYKESLDNCFVESIDYLSSLYEQEKSKSSNTVKMEENCLSVEEGVGKIDSACNFISQLLTHGNAAEILYMKRVVSAQLLYISSHLPNLQSSESNSYLAFGTAVSSFEKSVLNAFTQATPVSDAVSQGIENVQEENADLKSDVNADNFTWKDFPYDFPRDPSVSVTGSSEYNTEEARSAGNSEEDSKMFVEEHRIKVGEVGGAPGQFNSPQGLCVDQCGRIFVADTNNHRIQVFGKNLEFQYQFGKMGKKCGELFYPSRIAAFRHLTNVVFNDHQQEHSRLQIFTIAGIFVRTIYIGNIVTQLAALAVTDSSHIFVIDKISKYIHLISEVGQFLSSLNCGTAMINPSDLAIFPGSNELYICDMWAKAVLIFRHDNRFFVMKQMGRSESAFHPTCVDVGPVGVTSDATLSTGILIGFMDDQHFNAALFSREGQELITCPLPEIQLKSCSALRLSPEGDIVALSTSDNFLLVVKNCITKSLKR